MNKSEQKRFSGILAHITSLPSRFGIGDIGYSSWKFLDFLEEAGQTLWQFLPTVPTSPVFDNSPYMGSSAFAGSPLLLSMELLQEDKLLGSLPEPDPPFSNYVTEFERVKNFKKTLLWEAFNNFNISEPAFVSFRYECRWLEDYTLFMCLKEKYDQKGWFEWPEAIAKRNKKALAAEADSLRERINYYAFEQFQFHKQWKTLRQYAAEKNIRLIGDIPIYVAWDSADVWANQEIFELDRDSFQPLNVAGVPPDYFSKTGQRWGNPLYLWQSRDHHAKGHLYNWWTERFRSVFKMVDIARVDHFRGFESYWSVPASHKTAQKGRWIKGPGAEFFIKIQEKLGPLEIIAEDLGDISPEVIRMRDDLGFPGMKILQFAFDGSPDNHYLPFNFHETNNVTYTGTHDNDTALGWFLSDQLNDNQRLNIKNCCNRDSINDGHIHRDLLFLALSSTSRYAITPLQDLLGFGTDCRMNTPGEPSGNWSWRCADHFIARDLAAWMHQQCQRFNRIPAFPDKSKTRNS